MNAGDDVVGGVDGDWMKLSILDLWDDMSWIFGG